MQHMRWTLSGVLAAGMAIAAAGDLTAQTPEEVVKARQEAMGQMGKTFGVIVPIVKGENPNVTDAVPAATAVNDIAKKLKAVFPAGTGRDAVAKTRAKPEVWSKRAEFDAAADKLVAESAKLIDAAKTGNIDTFRAQFKVYVGACGGCHEGPKKDGGKFRYAEQ